VFEIQDRTYVYVLSSGNKVKMTPFLAGQRVGHYYTVTSGLTKDDKVVFEGTQSLRDGVQIEPKAMDADQAGRLAKN
jgi:membrane fusion protein (multidrug efflux system)